jgi:hypothetical protein
MLRGDGVMVQSFIPSLIWPYVLVALALAGAFWLHRRGAKLVATTFFFITSGACFLIMSSSQPASPESGTLFVMGVVTLSLGMRECLDQLVDMSEK